MLTLAHVLILNSARRLPALEVPLPLALTKRVCAFPLSLSLSVRSLFGNSQRRGMKRGSIVVRSTGSCVVRVFGQSGSRVTVT